MHLSREIWSHALQIASARYVSQEGTKPSETGPTLSPRLLRGHRWPFHNHCSDTP